MERLQAKIVNLRKVFSMSSGTSEDIVQEVERVRTTLRWFFDAMSDSNQTSSFVKMTTAIEALPGDPKEGTNITKRLSDRCSFLIANDSIERRELKKQFENAYDVRSKITD